MLDFHAHVLPGADHGSDGIKTSLRQLTLAEQAGIDTLVATPHFYPHADDFGVFLHKRAETYQLLLSQYTGSIRILPGAEVHLCVGLDHLEGLRYLCIPRTRVMLCELPLRTWSVGLTETLERLMDLGVQPVLAHVDRYDPAIIDNLFGLGLVGQVNAEPLTHPLRRRRLLPWIDQGSIVALGSDIHGTDVGYTQYLKAVKFLDARFDKIDRAARKLLRGVL